MQNRGENRVRKLEAGKIRVNFPALLLIATFTACGPSPRPIPVSPGTAGAVRTGVVPDAVSIAWRVDAGSGIFAPLVVDETAVLATTTNRMLVALAPADGRRYWYQRFDGSVVSGATIQDGVVFIGTEDRRGEAHGVEYRRGRKRWSHRVGTVRFAPLIDEDRVIFASDEGRLIALRTEDGARVWETRFTAAPAMQPMLHGERILLASTRDTLYAFSRAGARVAHLALPSTISATPLLHADTLVAPLQDGRVYVIALDSLTIARRYTVDAPVLAPPVRDSDAWFVLSRAGTLWRLTDRPERIASTNSAVRASLAGSNGRLVAGTLDGRVIAFDTNGSVVWEMDVGESVSAPVNIASSAIYVALLRGDVLALRAGTGRSSH